MNADDYFRIDSGFLSPPLEPNFADGDFNYDGNINADDYFLIDSAFLAQTTPAASASQPVMAIDDLPAVRTRRVRAAPGAKGFVRRAR